MGIPRSCTNTLAKQKPLMGASLKACESIQIDELFIGWLHGVGGGGGGLYNARSTE